MMMSLPIARCRLHVRFCGLLLALVVSATLGCTHLHRDSGSDEATPDVAAYLANLPPATTELLLVVGEEGGYMARLYALERQGAGWRRHLGPLEATVGRNGFAPVGEKREGDGKTPAGLFPLEFVFGYAPGAATRMPYRQGTQNDVWVDDPNSPDYNRWVRKGETSAASYEEMKLPDSRYRHGVVIGYNRDPVVKGMGSAIFLHGRLAQGRPTAGCVALAEEDLVALISWLDPARRPLILMGTGRDLMLLAAGAGEGRSP